MVRHRPSVLIVDDEPHLSRALAMGLRMEGFETETAASAKAALQILARRSFELAMVDLMMPETHGLELARSIRLLQPSCRVILTSAYHLTERQLMNADCGAVGFVPKPYDLDEVARFLRAKVESG